MDTKPVRIEQTVDYAALKRLVPTRGFGLARQVAEMLNFNKVKPLQAKLYTQNNVWQVMDKFYYDMNVEPAVIQLIEELWGKPIAEIDPTYNRVFPAKKFKRSKVVA